jgi:hypothetical protein
MRPEALRHTITQLVDTHGLTKAAEILHLNPGTVTRLLAGLRVQPGTLAQAQLALSSTPIPSDIAR